MNCSIVNNQVSWPRTIISSLPVFGLFLSYINQPHLYFKKDTLKTLKTHPATNAVWSSSLMRQKALVVSELANLSPQVYQSQDEERVKHLLELHDNSVDLRQAMLQLHRASVECYIQSKWDILRLYDKELHTLCNKRKTYDKAALISHILTLGILAALAASQIMPLPYLGLGAISLIGIILHISSYRRVSFIQKVEAVVTSRPCLIVV